MREVELIQGTESLLQVLLAEQGQVLDEPEALEVLASILDYFSHKVYMGAEFMAFLASLSGGPDFNEDQAGKGFRLWLYNRSVPCLELSESHFACFGYIVLLLQQNETLRRIVAGMLEGMIRQENLHAFQYTGTRH